MTCEAFIYDAVRTPRGKGKKDGALHEVKPITLLTQQLNALQDRNDLDTARVEDVILGCVTPVGDQGACIAKTAALAAGWDQGVAGMQLNRFCSSGLEAVNIAAAKIRAGWTDLAVAGGVEAMSRVPMGSDGGAMALDPEINMKIGFVPQGISADLIATREGFSREAVDAYSLRSQQRAVAARDAGYFKRTLVPVCDQNGVPILDHDELIRADATMESLGSLKPAFEMMGGLGFDDVAMHKYPEVDRIHHVHTPGNSSGIVDGATVMLIGSEAAGREQGLTPRARIVAAATVSTEPTIMLEGPAPATFKVLQKAGMSVDDIDLYEVNEAFAAVVMKFQKETGVPDEKLNVNGGSIAMGHPLGATGAIILGMLVDELERRKLRYGLATLCVGGGMGVATIVERV